MMNVRPLRTDDDLARKVAEIEAYFEKAPVPGFPQADRFDVLAALIEA